jgi:hypothetical protein
MSVYFEEGRLGEIGCKVCQATVWCTACGQGTSALDIGTALATVALEF